jgi:hypothetical protein
MQLGRLVLLSGMLFLSSNSEAANKKVTAYFSPPLTAAFRDIVAKMSAADMAKGIVGYSAVAVKSDELEAWVIPSSSKKYIYVTDGLLRILTEKDLKCVLGHEIGHVELGHWEKALAVSAGTSLGMSILNIFVPCAGYASYAVNPLVNKAFSRAQEIDADLFSFKMMNQFYGYGVDTYVSHLETLKFVSGKKTDRTGWLDSHPNLTARIDRCRQYAAENNLIEIAVTETTPQEAVVDTAQWTLYFSLGNGHAFYYDESSIRRVSEEQATVRDRITLPAGHQSELAYVLHDISIDCIGKMWRESNIEATTVSRERKRYTSRHAEWEPIQDGSTLHILALRTCAAIKAQEKNESQ